MSELWRTTIGGILFDLDGTLVCSRRLIEQVLGNWARKIGRDPVALIADSHGRRTQDIVSRYCPVGLDAQFEYEQLTRLFNEATDGFAAISGAREFLQSLQDVPWGIVTSAERELAQSRLQMVGLPLPQVLVAAEDVEQGKPNPQGYLLGASLLGIAAQNVLVFEDATAGITAAQAAGMSVLVVGESDPSAAGLVHIHGFDEVCVMPTDVPVQWSLCVRA